MADLRALSHACTAALADADAHGAKIAAHFLRVQIRELFREVHYQAHAEPERLPPLDRKS